jgi:hypothetical protein
MHLLLSFPYFKKETAPQKKNEPKFPCMAEKSGMNPGSTQG